MHKATKRRLTEDEMRARGYFTHVHGRIKAARLAHQLTQPAFAAALGVDQGYLSRVENGKAKASLEILLGIAEKFPEVSTRWLLSGRGSLWRQLSYDEAGSEADRPSVDALEIAVYALRMISDRQGVSADVEAHALVELYSVYPPAFRFALETLGAESETEAHRIAKAESRAALDCAAEILSKIRALRESGELPGALSLEQEARLVAQLHNIYVQMYRFTLRGAAPPGRDRQADAHDAARRETFAAYRDMASVFFPAASAGTARAPRNRKADTR